MAARGIYFSAAGDYVYHNNTGGLFTGTQDLVVCGWHRVRSLASPHNYSTNFRGIGLVRDATNVGNLDEHEACFFAQNSTYDPTTSPIQFATGYFGSSGSIQIHDISTRVVDEDWFEAIVYDHTTDQYTFYYGKDASGTLASYLDTQTSSYTPHSIILGGCENLGDTGVCHSDITEVRVWVGNSIASSFTSGGGAGLLAEKESDVPVITSNLYAHWKMASSSDLTDYSGNARTLTSAGSLGSGIMDPVDLQGGGGGGSDVFFEGLQNLSNGFKAATAAGMQGVIVT